MHAWTVALAGTTCAVVAQSPTSSEARAAAWKMYQEMEWTSRVEGVWRPAGAKIQGGSGGVFKTTEGGKCRQRVLFEGGSAGVVDLVMDPTDRRTLRAAVWARLG